MSILRLFILFMFSFTTLLATASVNVARDINYASNAAERNTLNVFYEDDGIANKPVVVFIHGGSWSKGKKETYWWLGRNFAKKGVVAVIINYTLAPVGNYEKMAADCALAMKWTKENAGTYQGSGDNIFVMGHSAGGHLAELINADPRYFAALKMKNPIRGVILDDAFGLDMNEYLTKAERDDYYTDFIRTFSTDPTIWTDGSPLHYAENIKNPHILFYGGKTFPAIQIQTPQLYNILKDNAVAVEMKVIPKKNHVGMITQMIFGSNDMYSYIVDFIKNNFHDV